MSEPPVVLVHGWGGSYARTWQQPGWQALLEDAGRRVVGVDLLGHGTAPKPHDPAAYADLTTRVVDAAGDGPIDAVGFSLGAMTLLELATREPERFNRLAVLGVGRNLFERDLDRAKRIIAAVEGVGSDDVEAQLFAQYSRQPGNDPVALAAIMKRTGVRDFTKDLGRVVCPVLVVMGDKDFAGPADPLVAALPDARAVVVRNCDHFATTEAFAAIDAVLEFLEAAPG
jgi:pimeloyl-ACP methyl ester carboxylesterase